MARHDFSKKIVGLQSSAKIGQRMDRDGGFVADDDQVLAVGDHLKVTPFDLQLERVAADLFVDIFDFASDHATALQGLG